MYGGLTRASTSSPRLATFRPPITHLRHTPRRALSSFPPTSRQETERQIAFLASKPITPLTLTDLVKFGHPPLSTPALLSSAQFALSRLPIRLAHRLQALRSLPFIVVTNPNVSQIYNTYLHSLSTLLPFQDREIRSTDDEKLFSDVLADLVQAHGSTITTLAQGFAESKKYLGAETVGRFLDTHLRARIGTRLIGEQHLALHVATAEAEAEATTGGGKTTSQSPFIGVINTRIHPEKLLRSIEAFVGEICELKYGVRPALRITGTLKDRNGSDLTFTHIPVHLEYILTELLKNAFRATVENGMSREGVEVTVAIHRPESTFSRDRAKGNDVIANEPGVSLPEEDDGPPLGTAAFSPRNSRVAQRSPGSGADNLSPEGHGTDEETITFRIRDRGGGIPPDVMSEIWKYSFTTVETSSVTDSVDLNMGMAMDVSRSAGADTKIAGMGYGLPLSRAYAEFFGGTLKVVSLFGWGCDVYLVLKGLRGVS